MFFDKIGSVSGVYVIRVQKTDKYKIGKTINLKRRVKQFSTGNPENLKIVFFMKTEHYQSFEKHLHELYKDLRIKGEWFTFEETRLKELESLLQFVSQSAPNTFELFNVKKTSVQGRVF